MSAPSIPCGARAATACRSSRVAMPPAVSTAAEVRSHTLRKRPRLGPQRVPSRPTSVTTYRAQPASSTRASASHRSPESVPWPVRRTGRLAPIRSLRHQMQPRGALLLEGQRGLDGVRVVALRHVAVRDQVHHPVTGYVHRREEAEPGPHSVLPTGAVSCESRDIPRALSWGPRSLFGEAAAAGRSGGDGGQAQDAPLRPQGGRGRPAVLARRAGQHLVITMQASTSRVPFAPAAGMCGPGRRILG